MILGSFKTKIQIDDPATGEARDVHIRVKRFDVEEGTRFMRDYARSANAPSDALVCRLPAGDEQEKDDKGAFVVGDQEVRRRRLSAMTDAEREAFYAMENAEEDFSNAFLNDTFRKYVRVEGDFHVADDFEDPDTPPQPVKTGLDLVRALGGRADVVSSLLRAVYLENTQSEAAKKVLRPLFASAPFLAAREKDQPGPTPELTAEHAGSAVSVQSAAADLAEALIPCGSATEG